MKETKSHRRTFLEKAGTAAVTTALLAGAAGIAYLGFFRDGKKSRNSRNLDRVLEDEISERKLKLKETAEESYLRLKSAEYSAIPLESYEDFCKIGRNQNYPLDGNYVLKRDVNFGKKDFEPVGEKIGNLGSLPFHEHEGRILKSSKSIFNGTINGNGYSISNLQIRPEEDSVIFRYTGPNFLMSNLVFKNCKVNSKSGGSLISYYNFGSAFGCFFSDINVGGSNGSAPAFLYNFGNVVDCGSSCSIKDKEISSASGMVRTNIGNVSGCYSQIDFNGDSFLGGIVCDNWFDGLVVDSCSIGNMNGRANLGGVCSLNKGLVGNCYSLVKILGEQNIGGVVAINNGGRIIACYENENVHGNRDFNSVCPNQIGGGIIGTRSSSEISGFRASHYWTKRLDPEIYGEVLERMQERGFSLSP